MTDAEAVARGHEIFDPIAERYLEMPDVDMGRMFASEGLRIRGKIFSLISFDGQLMLKLPAARTVELVEAGDAERVEMAGRAMREWVFVPADKAALWDPLVGEAFAYLDEITP
jgi:TfoX/Sxy family transcriptional regulator of competence genes